MPCTDGRAWLSMDSCNPFMASAWRPCTHGADVRYKDWAVRSGWRPVFCWFSPLRVSQGSQGCFVLPYSLHHFTRWPRVRAESGSAAPPFRRALALWLSRPPLRSTTLRRSKIGAANVARAVTIATGRCASVGTFGTALARAEAPFRLV